MVATCPFAEFVAGPLIEAFSPPVRRAGRGLDRGGGRGEKAVLMVNRLADVAFGAR